MSGYFVIGNPVSQSLSPEIHEQFAQQFDTVIQYKRYEIDKGFFIEGMGQLRREQAPEGCNVTAPFKSDAYDYSEVRTDRAKLARAVNTLTFRDGRVYGDNTDGIGFLRDLTQRWKFDPVGKTLLVLGAGGAVRGLLSSLKDAGFKKIYVANRSQEHVNDLIKDFGVEPLLFTDTWQGGYDLIVNATTAGFSHATPPVPNGAFKDAQLAYDLNYGQVTPFMELARTSHAKQVVDGLGMLVEQAAESFYVWFGKNPQTESVYQSLREYLAKQPRL